MIEHNIKLTAKKDTVPDRELKSTGLVVADKVRRIRSNKMFSYADLHHRLEELDHHLPILALRRIESGARRVDVDDLTALAAALETSVTALLTPDDSVVITPISTGVPKSIDVEEFRAWITGTIDLTDDQRRQYWMLQHNTLFFTRNSLQQEIDDLRGLIVDQNTSTIVQHRLDELIRELKALDEREEYIESKIRSLEQ